LQRLVERQIQRYLKQYSDVGIRNAASLVVDTRDMSVAAWVGSADYWDDAIHGQVNGVLAKRSPGSALKPFVYALALDQGVLHPETMVRDAPTAFGPFTPDNFDGCSLVGTRAVAEGALPWRPTTGGAHLIRIVDDHGRSAERDVNVQFERWAYAVRATGGRHIALIGDAALRLARQGRARRQREPGARG
jgi:membrane carboxypeptidase/penicillin-binding protein PbpC